MNAAQNINLTVAFATILAIGYSMRNFSPTLEFLPQWLMAVWLLLLRLKFFADDHVYFKTMQSNPFNRVGLLIGVVSWVTFYAAANSLETLVTASYWMLASLMISTVWIIAVALKEGAYREQLYWLGTNSIYMAALYAASIAAPHSALMYAAIAVLYLAIIGDYAASKSLSQLEK